MADVFRKLRERDSSRKRGGGSSYRSRDEDSSDSPFRRRSSSTSSSPFTRKKKKEEEEREYAYAPPAPREKGVIYEYEARPWSEVFKELGLLAFEAALGCKPKGNWR